MTFEFNAKNQKKVEQIIAKYPADRQKSAVMPLLDLAQRQNNNWISKDVIACIAQILKMPEIKVYEVASFYTMYNLVPVGRFHVQVCGTTPCMLRGSDAIMAACKSRGMHKGHTTDDGLWTLTEVECMGNCASAPMVQINDDNFEDLTPERLDVVLDALAAGKTPKAGTQEPGRHTVEPVGGPSTLTDMVKANHDYRKEW